MLLIALRWKLKCMMSGAQLLHTGTVGYSELSLQNDKERYKETLSPATIKRLWIMKGNSFYRLEGCPGPFK